MKIKIIKKCLGKNYKNCFWYDGCIAIAKTKYGIYSLEVLGNLSVRFEKDGIIYNNHQAIEEAHRRNFTDIDLFKIGDVYGWNSIKRFQIVFIPNKDSNDTNKVDSTDYIAYNYDDAIKNLTLFAKD